MINLKTLSRIALAATLFSAIPSAGALAIAATTTTAPMTPPAAAAAAAADQRLINLKTKGTTEIDRRLANISAATIKLNASKTLLPADKTALARQLSDEAAELTALKAKLATETTLAGARADVVSIITDYRAYSVTLPRARLIATYDRYKLVEANLIALQVKLQAKLDAAKAAGKDTTTAQAKMADLLVQLKGAQAAGNGVGAKLLALQPSDYKTSHTALVGYRANLKAAQTYVKAARDDAQAVVAALKNY